jgi:protein TonB
MFEKLVVSSSERRKHTTARYFVSTSLVYMFTVAAALALSVYWTSPKLADSNPSMRPPIVWPAASSAERPKPVAPKGNQGAATQPANANPMKVKRLDDIIEGMRDQQRRLIPISTPQVFSDGPSTPGSVGSKIPGMGNAPGGGDGFEKSEAPRPEPPAPEVTRVEPQRPVRIHSSVLQGKAIRRVTPPYPPIAKPIRLQGDVSVEVIISPQGSVEAARVVSGHPVFAQAARDAALAWRFEPTLLNKIPVRVTGVITFVFRMAE